MRATGGSKDALAGCAVLSGYLPVPGKVPETLSEAARGTPVSFFHGDADAVVRPTWGQDALAHVVRRGFTPADDLTASVASKAKAKVPSAEGGSSAGGTKLESTEVKTDGSTSSGAGSSVQFKWYEGMGHSASEEELKDVTLFIRRVLGDPKAEA